MDMHAIRNAKLRGIRAAAEAHLKLGIREEIKEGMEFIDVFHSINELGVTILFKPLDGLLGAFISKPDKGIMVTTNRRLPIQRFTAAHELGHFWLKHEESLDSEDTISLARQGVSNIPTQEIEAEAFASEFLLTKLLLVRTARKLGWNKSDFKNPDIVYQLSLRTGTSYDATRLALLENKLINLNTSNKLGTVSPKVSKAHFLRNEELKNPWADVHLITPDDNGSIIHASAEDTVIIELPEHTDGGYIWTTFENDSNIELIGDVSIQDSSNSCIGSINKRRLSLHGINHSTIHLEEKRPWEISKKPIETFEIDINFDVKEEGLPRVVRKWM